MGYIDNPAQRLHFVFEQLRSAEIRRNNTAVTIRQAIIRQFGVAHEDRAVMRFVADVAELPEAAEAAIKAVVGEDPFYLEWRASIDTAVSRFGNLTMPVEQIRKDVDNAAMMNLAGALRRVADVSDEGDEVASLIGELEQVAEAVTASSLPENLKRFLLDQIDRVRVALREYRIRGSEGLTDATDAALGVILRARQAFPDEAFSEQDRGVIKRFFGVLSKVGDLAAKANAVVALSDKAYQFLLALGS